jgi:predicted Holliday junction resolvase-like endonuclease
MTWAVALLAVVVVALVAVVLRQGRNLSREREVRASEAGGFQEKIRLAREDSVARSRVANLAKAAERVAPLLPGFDYDPADVQWVGGTVDFIVWHGLSRDDAKVEVVLLDVKNGKADLNQRQRRIRNAVEEKRVRFDVFRPQLSEPELEAADDVLAVEAGNELSAVFLANRDSYPDATPSGLAGKSGGIDSDIGGDLELFIQGGRADHHHAVRVNVDAAAQAAGGIRQGGPSDGSAREPRHRRSERGLQGTRRAGQAGRPG